MELNHLYNYFSVYFRPRRRNRKRKDCLAAIKKMPCMNAEAINASGKKTGSFYASVKTLKTKKSGRNSAEPQL